MPASANRRPPNKSVTEWLLFCLVFLAIGSYLDYFLREDYARIEARERDHWNRSILHYCAMFAALAGLAGLSLHLYQSRRSPLQRFHS
jgi:hypothetical protein